MEGDRQNGSTNQVCPGSIATGHAHSALFQDSPDDGFSSITLSWDGVDPTTATIATALGATPPPFTNTTGLQLIFRSVDPDDYDIGVSFLIGGWATGLLFAVFLLRRRR